MVASAGIDSDFRFLVLAVTKQIDRARVVLHEPSEPSREGITRGDDYIDVLKSRIENRCFSSLHDTPATDVETVNWIRAINVVTVNLERIADFAVNMARQTAHFTESSFLRNYDYDSLFGEVLGGVECIVEALSNRDSSLAFRICRADDVIDGLYQRLFATILNDLDEGGSAHNLVTALFIFHYLERMGDALRNIGEAVLSVVVGERLKIRQYEVLRESMPSHAEEPKLSDLSFAPIWGTRSGCRLGRVSETSDPEHTEEAIFKDGSPDKLLRERDAIDRWSAVMPGLPPRVLQAKREGQDATLMLQFLGGRTLQEIVLGEEAGLLDTAVAHVQDTFRAVWRTTIRPVAVNADFLGQLKGRLGDVYRVHPEFQGPDKQVGSLHVPSFARLLAASAEISAALPAPFSVLVHGDLNIDNILFDSEEGKLHLVDLHRSTESDYVQDVSVFLASNFRLPLFDEPHRKRMDEVALGFCAFVRDFAREQNDATFEARLALALARSFTTSTRFELNPPFARAMHVRSVCLLEQLIAHRPRPWSAYRFPTDILVF